MDEVIQYLNSLTGSAYQLTDQIRCDMQILLDNGYNFSQMKYVVKKKYLQWKGSEFAQYIRPSTLFGDKFKTYLDERTTKTRIERLAESVERAKSFSRGMGKK